MKDNWKQIKKDITENLKDIFEGGNLPRYTNFDLAVELFKNVLLYRTGIKKLDGLYESVLESIFEIYNSKPGKVNPVENLLNNIEPFLKKVIFIRTGVDLTNNTQKNLMPCLKELNLIQIDPTTTSHYNLVENLLPTYVNSPHYLHYLCKAYISRNSFHNAPKLKAVEVIQVAESALVVYIHTILLHFTD